MFCRVLNEFYQTASNEFTSLCFNVSMTSDFIYRFHLHIFEKCFTDANAFF